MKQITTRILSLLCLAMMAIATTALAACSTDETEELTEKTTPEGNADNGKDDNANGNENPNGNSDTSGDTTQDKTTGSKTLIVYFSRAGENWQVGNVERGNTAVMGDYIQELTGADVFEIIPEVAYPNDYYETIEIANRERDTNARPAIKNKLENLSDYSTVFIGSGIWGGRPPMIMNTFYDTYPELAGKMLIPFGTHGGSGISSISSLLRQYFPNATMLEGLGISGSQIRSESSKTAVRNWLTKIGITINETADNSNMTNDTESIKLWLDRWDKAMIEQDVETLGAMMADDMIVTHITGDTQTKQEWLDEVKAGSMKYYDIQLENLKIEVSGDRATASFISVIEANIWGSHGTWRINTTMYLRRNGSDWVRVNKP